MYRFRLNLITHFPASLVFEISAKLKFILIGLDHYVVSIYYYGIGTSLINYFHEIGTALIYQFIFNSKCI